MAISKINTNSIADDAVTTAKVNPAQTDITSVGTLTGLATSGDVQVGDGTDKLGINTDDPHSFLDVSVQGFDSGRRFGVGYNDNIVSIYSHAGTGGLENLSVRGDNIMFYSDYDAGNPDGVERLRIDSNGRILATTTGARSIIGRGAYTGITVDAGSTTSVAGQNGVLFNMVMVSTGGGFGAVYSMAYNSTVNMIHGTGNFSSTSGTSSSTNVYKSSGSHAVTLQNNTSSAISYYILLLVSYD